MNATRTIAVTSGIAAVLTATALLTGCTPINTTPPPVANEAGVRFEHIHELVPDPKDGSLLVATHEGLYRLTIGIDGSAIADGPIGGLDFDPMGFTLSDGIAYASGHPGPTTPDTFGNPNLGLITSTDLGQSWTNVSLTGVTDFHGLTVATGSADVRVFGYDGARQLIVTSSDGGASWVDGAELTARDILASADLLYATTADGLAVSSDDGMTFTIDADAPALYVIAADPAGTLAGVDATGTVWTLPVGGEWVHGHTVQGIPQAFAVDGERIYVADDRGVAYTDDAGATWTVVAVTR
jgi:hypothetical protein